MTTGDQSPMIPAIELSRLRDRSMGQADEVQALFDIMKGAGELMELVNGTLWAMIKGKHDKSADYKRQIINDASITLFSGMEKFVDAKSNRVSKLINYLQMLAQDVNDEKSQLASFDKDWDPIRRDINLARIQIANPNFLPTVEEGEKTMNHIKNDILAKGVPILNKLIELENKMQKRHLSAIALLTKMNSSVDTNELYKLLTRDL